MRALLLVFGLAAIVLLFNSLYVINENQVGVLFEFGRIKGEDTESGAYKGIGPGIHFKIPLMQTVRVFDRRILTLDSQPERHLTGEKKDVLVDFFAKWRIADVGRYYKTTNGDEMGALARLNPIVREAIRNEINQRTLQEVVADVRSNLGQRLVEVSNEAAETLGVEVVDIRIKRIDFPEDSNVLDSVYKRMRAERERVANELRAQGEEASEKIKSSADRERQVLIAETERDAQRLRGEGDARAIQLYAEAHTADPEFYGFYRSLESYRRAFASGNDVLVLDPGSEFFRYFDETDPSKPR